MIVEASQATSAELTNAHESLDIGDYAEMPIVEQEPHLTIALHAASFVKQAVVNIACLAEDGQLVDVQHQDAELQLILDLGYLIQGDGAVAVVPIHSTYIFA